MSNITKPGFIEYKCRRCGEIDRSTHVPGLLTVLLGVMNDYNIIPKEWFGTPVTQTGIHHCKDGGAGVTDLIGGVPDE